MMSAHPNQGPHRYPRHLEEWQSEKREQTCTRAKRAPRRPSAAERTVSLPGVDTREQADHAEPWIKPKGKVRRAVSSFTSVHLAYHADPSKALCGQSTTIPDIGQGSGPICQACRAEASRRLLEVAR